MKSNTSLKRSDFWKIECLSCGINCDLLIDGHQRIICRECLNRDELNEVENEIYAESDNEEMDFGDRDVLPCPNNGRENDGSARDESTHEINGGI
jgi:hypothetical protein